MTRDELFTEFAERLEQAHKDNEAMSNHITGLQHELADVGAELEQAQATIKRLREVLKIAQPYLEEDYYPNCCSRGFHLAVMAVRKAMEGKNES